MGKRTRRERAQMKKEAALGVKPFLNWIGGKQNLQRIIRPVMPRKIRRYAEHFGGSGALLLGGPRRRGVIEVYNDYNGDLANLFACVKCRPLALMRELRFLPLHSEQDFIFLKGLMEHILTEPDFSRSEREVAREFFTGRDLAEMEAILRKKTEMFDVRRAAAFYVINRGSFNGTMNSFGAKPLYFRNFLEDIERASYRLEGVPILHRDFASSVKLNDAPETLHYFDPPYYQAEGVYPLPFGTQDHMRVHKAVQMTLGYSVVSYNYHEFICDLFSDMYILKFERTNEMSQKKGAKYTEVLITNYDPRPMIEANQAQLSMFGPPDLEQEKAELVLINKPSSPTRHEDPANWAPTKMIT